MSGEGFLPARDVAREGRSRIPRNSVICPVCQANGTIHGSEHVTSLVKTLWCRCANILCGMTWRMQLSFEYVVSPSALAHPDLDLPVAPANARRLGTADEAPPPAPDPNQLSMFDGEGQPADACPAST